ncbi:hypothetical protein [Micropruina sp.]|uniref:hypothetical protein n=1 Tax=Micropruina sp. TaxID=2737536 RepID=UPI0039E2B8F4
MPTSAQILKTAKTLPRAERAELAQQLLATLGEHDVPEAARLNTLRSAVSSGITALDADDGIEVPPEGLREYLSERGRLATERAAAKTS